jgi:hypothetical protein
MPIRPPVAHGAQPAQLGSMHPTKGRTMVKAVVLYGPPEDPDAFERY